MEKVSNHFVPQFYLKNFSANKKSIGLYIVRKNIYTKESSIKNQACKDFLYGQDGQVEDFLAHIEKKSAKIINNIINTLKVPSYQSPDYTLLLIFMLLSEARSLKTADAVNNLVDTQMKILAKMDRNLTLSDEQIDSFKISMDIPNLNPIKVVFETFPILLDLRCSLILNKTDRQFITSDNPLVKYNLMYARRKYNIRGYGLANMGIQLFFPITPKLCICIYDDVLYKCELNNDGIIEINKGKQMDEINRLIFLNSYEKVFFNDIKKLYLDKLSVNYINSKTLLSKDISTYGTHDDVFIRYSPRKVNDLINLSFFEIGREYMEMPLPSHMAGPTRPYAQNFSNGLKSKRNSNLF